MMKLALAALMMGVVVGTAPAASACRYSRPLNHPDVLSRAVAFTATVEAVTRAPLEEGDWEGGYAQFQLLPQESVRGELPPAFVVEVGYGDYLITFGCAPKRAFEEKLLATPVGGRLFVLAWYRDGTTLDIIDVGRVGTAHGVRLQNEVAALSQLP